MSEPVVSQYTICPLPEHDVNHHHLYAVTVDRMQQMDGAVVWAVRWMGRCLSRTGVWDVEPSSRSKGWLRSHRFGSLKDALKVAVAQADAITVNGITAAEAAKGKGSST